MDTLFVIIGVGGAGVKAVDKMAIPNSQKVFIGGLSILYDVKSDGIRLPIDEDGFIEGIRPKYYRNRAIEKKVEIKKAIVEAFRGREINHNHKDS